MIRTIMLAGALLACPLAMFADGVISGSVVNKDSGEPMDFVTVQLINEKGKPMPIGTNTDEKGLFRLPKVKDGKYTVRITNIGSFTQERPVTVAGGNINIGVVKLADDTKVLQEVVVEGIRSQMRFELDKKVFTVDANIAAAGQSASELLESIPSVEVDQDGEVSLRGNTSVTVWINGKHRTHRGNHQPLGKIQSGRDCRHHQHHPQERQARRLFRQRRTHRQHIRGRQCRIQHKLQ